MAVEFAYDQWCINTKDFYMTVFTQNPGALKSLVAQRAFVSNHLFSRDNGARGWFWRVESRGKGGSGRELNGRRRSWVGVFFVATRMCLAQ